MRQLPASAKAHTSRLKQGDTGCCPPAAHATATATLRTCPQVKAKALEGLQDTDKARRMSGKQWFMQDKVQAAREQQGGEEVGGGSCGEAYPCPQRVGVGGRAPLWTHSLPPTGLGRRDRALCARKGTPMLGAAAPPSVCVR